MQPFHFHGYSNEIIEKCSTQNGQMFYLIPLLTLTIISEDLTNLKFLSIFLAICFWQYRINSTFLLDYNHSYFAGENNFIAVCRPIIYQGNELNKTGKIQVCNIKYIGKAIKCQKNAYKFQFPLLCFIVRTVNY